jgi:hypothetical protein
LVSNLSRGKTIPIAVQFLGIAYNTPVQSLPWYNTLAWTVFVTPVGFLFFGAFGLWVSLRLWRSEPVGLLAGGHWAFLMILRALPHTLGAKWAVEKWGRLGKLAIAAAIIEGVVSLAVMMPVPLAYFSPLIGGLPGASALGMEPTYYWDALNRESRRWLVASTPPGSTIQFATFPHSWLYLRQTGELPRRLVPIDRGQPTWYVVQNRPGAFSDADRGLATQGRPAYTIRKLGVPLAWIFPYSEFLRMNRGQRTTPEHSDRTLER